MDGSGSGSVSTPKNIFAQNFYLTVQQHLNKSVQIHLVEIHLRSKTQSGQNP